MAWRRRILNCLLPRISNLKSVTPWLDAPEKFKNTNMAMPNATATRVARFFILGRRWLLHTAHVRYLIS